MTATRVFLLLLVVTMVTASASAQHKPRRRKAPAPSAETARLDAILARFQRVRMPFRAAGLTARERRMVQKLVEASAYLEEIYWRQSDPDGLALLQSVEGSAAPLDLARRRLLMIFGSRYDLLQDNQPFVGDEPMAPGRGLYPRGVTRDQIEQYAKEHPEKKAELYSPTTVVRRDGDELVGVPYHVAYRSFLEPAAKALRAAAALSSDPAFAAFLRARAQALLSDDYYPSDLLWLDLKDPKVDVIFAPYETYLDGVLGVKASYGAAVLIRDPAESAKLAVFQKYLPAIQDALPLPAEDRPSVRGHATPMEVMEAPYRAGDLRHGYQAVADNLPNDPRIHQEKGTKKIFFKNFMDARVNYVVLPLARKLMPPAQAAQASPDGYLTDTLMHEIAHGLGPAFSRREGKKVSIREAMGPAYPGLEEAKADVVGMVGLKWLVDHGALPKEKLPGYYASYLAGILRTVRFGVAEAHGRAEMMEFNYLSEQKAIVRDAGGRYALDAARLPAALQSLAQELLEQEATGDHERAEAWFARYGSMPAELQSALKSAATVPVDIEPIFSFAERVQ